MMDTRLRGRRGADRRRRQLDRHPLCCHCQQEDRVELAVIADHIDALVNGGRDNGPLQSLCREHHRLKTAKDMGYNAKRRYGCDAHGHSLDPEHPRNARGATAGGAGPTLTPTDRPPLARFTRKNVLKK